ncbi:putative LPS assembly protein LptD [Alistipes sp. CHKCI003]|uniref:putative LPS assembly protein LptD n=1 Tax=Alistipes sp. CHKCI003 TaxID=1780376 RepID=UPI0007A8ED22|nr:putative LPS assembly protein LptD [Alistipes sp. CHKCI003]CVI71096.1 hypothetical protein BN3659_02082 [Alistipes sp. CHKCI003]
MNRKGVKYLISATAVLLFAQGVFGYSGLRTPPFAAAPDTLAAPAVRAGVERPDTAAPSLQPAAESRRERRQRLRSLRLRQSELPQRPDTLPARPDSASGAMPPSGTGPLAPADSLGSRADSTAMPADTARRGGGGFLDDIISGKNKDSLVYDLANNTVYIYNEGDVTYQTSNLKADYMRINMETKEIYAYGKADTVEGKPSVTHPVFQEGASSYTMDTITYNIDSKKAKIKGVATQEGDGWLIGGSVKKMPDNTINIQHGKYTTCDETGHPHFYLAMTKAKVIPGKKVITGPAYLVMEDVPIYFLGIPEGFFPISSGPKSGLLMPTFGEEYTKGFFIRDLGYYFTFGDYADLAVRGGIYTLGSWEASAESRYIKRYKYSGNFGFEYSSIRVGEKGEPDFVKQNNFRLQWTHSQDPKANPGSTFSASVNFTTSGYSKYSATNLNDILSTQTNSTISYSKSWAGTPFSMSAQMAVSQNSNTEEITATLPTITFNVSRFKPFKRKEAVGKERWYEKITMSYSGKMTNKMQAKESEFFSKETLQNMENGIEHQIPVSASFNVFNYINVSPSFNYTEKWYFKKNEKAFNPITNKAEFLDPEYGFWRLYNYSASISASTTLYGMYETKKKTRKLQAVRHTINPTIGFSYTPDFKALERGYWKAVQSDSTGRVEVYSPFSNNAYGVPSSVEAASLTFSLGQTLEMKVLSKRDTSGVKKVKLIDELSISGSYNLIADSMGLSNLPLRLRSTIIKNFGINISATLDPYEVTPEGQRINKLMWRRGLPGRIVNASTSFGYTFNSRSDNSVPAINDINSIDPLYQNPFYDPYGQMDPVLRRQYMAQTYYDFSLPWNLGFTYSINYGISYVNNGTTGYKKNVQQSINFNGNINLTPKTGITFQGGFNISEGELTTSSITITRDLHCWQMSFSWIPFGFHRSWSFNIGVKAASLADLKYDKSQSMYDNMF